MLLVDKLTDRRYDLSAHVADLSLAARSGDGF